MGKNAWITPPGKFYHLYKDMLSQNHLLIAGVNGSGKSVLINALVYTALQEAPTDCKFILCDPKMVELVRYQDLPHTLRYADTLEGIAAALESAHKTMMERFSDMKKRRVVEWEGQHIYIIVDEFADLVCKGPDRAENKLRSSCEQYIESISKLGRAAHVHLILATQAPNRKTLKANILLNMTARVGLRCMFPIESKQIIGTDMCCTLPNPKTSGRAEAYYFKDLSLERWEIPMIPAEDIKERIEWWESQKPRGFWEKRHGQYDRVMRENGWCLK